MSTSHRHAATPSWDTYATATLRSHGTRASEARAAVIATLAEQDCCASAQEIHERLRLEGSRVGLASVYRTLDLLQRHDLITRVDTGDGTARYEPHDPTGEHHHHLVCTRCGRVEAFEDGALERAIHAVGDHVDFRVTGHDITLRGLCRDCR
jgi:Fur family ferric uptake transcriptional regulator